jgi:nucleoside-diphosphate-sugar epimerase
MTVQTLSRENLQSPTIPAAQPSALHVVIGASGSIGNAVVRTLAAQGKRVRAVNRSGRAELPAGVELVKGNAADPASMRDVCRGAAVVYNCANVLYTDWAEKFPPIMDGVIAGAAAAGAKLVFADNLYMYGKVTGLITEDLPYAATTRKGRVRARLADTLMAAHRAGVVRAAIGRASDFYGPGAVNSAAGDLTMRPLLEGKKAMWAGSLDVLHTLTYVDDFARGLITLGERDQALGQVWHIPGAAPLTGRQFLSLAFEVAGLPPKIGAYARPIMTAVSLFSPMVREVVEMLYQFEAPFVVDGSKFARTFGFSPATSHREALQHTLAWFRAHPKSKIRHFRSGVLPE